MSAAPEPRSVPPGLVGIAIVLAVVGLAIVELTVQVEDSRSRDPSELAQLLNVLFSFSSAFC